MPKSSTPKISAGRTVSSLPAGKAGLKSQVSSKKKATSKISAAKLDSSREDSYPAPVAKAAALPGKIFGHEREIARLNSELAEISVGGGERIHTPWLFVGPSKIGKFTLARAFAAAALCETTNYQLPATNCKCPSCLRFHALTHPSVLIIDRLWSENGEPDLDKVYASSNLDQGYRQSKGVKSDSIGVDDIRAILDRMRLSGGSSLRFCLIKRFDRATPEAQNAFLKFLEEPHPGLIFILTTTDEERLLPTIVSRCRTLRIANLPKTASDAALRTLSPEMFEIDREKIQLLAQGRIGRAIDLLGDHELFTEFSETYFRLEKLIHGMSVHERFTLAAELAAEKPHLERFLRLATYYFHHLLHKKGVGEKLPDVLAEKYEARSLTRILSQLSATRRYLRANVNPRLAMESLLLQI